MNFSLQANPFILFLILILLILGTSTPAGIELIGNGLASLRRAANHIYYAN